MKLPIILFADDRGIDTLAFGVKLSQKYRVLKATCCAEVCIRVKEQRQLKEPITLIVMDLRLREQADDPPDPASNTGYFLYLELKRLRLLTRTATIFVTNFTKDPFVLGLIQKGHQVFHKNTEPRKLLVAIDATVDQNLLKNGVNHE